MSIATTTALLRDVARLHTQVQRDGAACCGGTTNTQCVILTALGRCEPTTVADLSRQLGLDKGWVSRAVETLAQEELLVKTPSDEDRRAVLISMSPQGHERFDDLERTLNAQSDRIMEHIPEEERSGVYRALELLREALLVEAEMGTTCELPNAR
ncbi:MAG: MarR family transcriptional regulator [Nitrolancea sp.]